MADQVAEAPQDLRVIFKKIKTFAYEVHGDEVYIEIVVLSKINNFVVDMFL